MNRRTTTLVAIAALLLPQLSLGGDAAPQDGDDPVLEQITVVGSRAEASLTAPGIEQARERLAQSPGGTAIVDSEAYLEGRVGTLTDALGFAPGVFVQPRFGSEEARLSIRGSGIQRTFHLRGVRLLQDGVPLTLADGGGDFQAIEPLAARYIEVYRGANALEYGAADLGGAVNFVSPTGYDAPPRQVRAEGGDFGYRRAHASAASVVGRHDFFASTSGFGQDGFRGHASQETYRLFGNYGYRLSPNVETRTYLTQVHTRSELPGNLTLAELQSDPSQAAVSNVTNDYRRDFELTRLSNLTTWRFGEASQLDASVFYSSKHLDHPIFQVLLQDTEDYGAALRYRSEGRLGGRSNLLFAGVSLLRGDVSDDRFVNMGGSPGARTNRFEQTAVSLTAFVENQFRLLPDLALVAGAQFTRAERDSNDLFVTAFDESFSRSYQRLSPKLGVLYEPAGGLQLFANLSRSFEPPSFAEMSGGPNVTPVDAQTATTLEVGTRVTRGNLQMDVAVYDAQVRDELLSLTDAEGNPRGTVNAERTRHRGVEAGLTWQASSMLALSAAYLWNDFRFDGDAVYRDHRLAGIPPHLLRTELRIGGGRLYAAPNLEWVPQDYAVDHANTLEADGYSIWGVRVGGLMLEDLEWFVDGRNLSDRTYVATTGVIADALGQDSRQFLPGDGRAVYAGVQWRF